MQIIYDNIIFSLQKAGGISHYWCEMIRRLQTYENIVFFDFNNNNNICRNKLNIKTEKETFLLPQIIRYFPFTKKLQPKSIFHSSYYRITLQPYVVNITTVHDFIYEKYIKGIKAKVHTYQKKMAVTHSDGIICVSNNTKNDLLTFYPFIDEKKIKVIYHGVSENFKKLENSKNFLSGKFEILKNTKYILYVGDRSSYKNFNILIDLIKLLSDFCLVVVSSKEFDKKEVKQIEEIKEKVFIYNKIDNNELNMLYNNAYCLLYPSSYEGFGIPILEAMKAGCPVIATKKSSIPEVAGDAGLLVDEIKVDNFINMIKLLENKEVRNKLILKGLEQSKQFSWDKCFEETYNFYQEIWSKKFEG